VAIAFWLALILLAPKERLYDFLEHKLAEQGIVISGETMRWKPLGFAVEHARISYQGLDVGELSWLTLRTLLVYTQVHVGPFVTSPALGKIVKMSLKEANITHELWHPFTLYVELEGNFGRMRGTIDLQKRVIRLRVIKAWKIQLLKRFLKHDKAGWYYEQSF